MAFLSTSLAAETHPRDAQQLCPLCPASEPGSEGTAAQTLCVGLCEALSHGLALHFGLAGQAFLPERKSEQGHLPFLAMLPSNCCLNDG